MSNNTLKYLFAVILPQHIEEISADGYLGQAAFYFPVLQKISHLHRGGKMSFRGHIPALGYHQINRLTRHQFL